MASSEHESGFGTRQQQQAYTQQSRHEESVREIEHVQHVTEGNFEFPEPSPTRRLLVLGKSSSEGASRLFASSDGGVRCEDRDAPL